MDFYNIIMGIAFVLLGLIGCIGLINRALEKDFVFEVSDGYRIGVIGAGILGAYYFFFML